jgi:hypothetical protein
MMDQLGKTYGWLWADTTLEPRLYLRKALFDLSPETVDALTFLLVILDHLLSPVQLSKSTREDIWGVSLILYAMAVATSLVQNNADSRPFPADREGTHNITTLWDYMRSHLHGMIYEYLDLIRLRTGGEIDVAKIEKQWDMGGEHMILRSGQ